MLTGLNAGRSAGVGVVASADELDDLFGQLPRGGQVLEYSYPGNFAQLPDGTAVGISADVGVGRPDDRHRQTGPTADQDSRQSMTTNRLAAQLLVSGLDDWLHLADIAWAASQFARNDQHEDVTSVATEALAALLEHELIQIGEVNDGGFFEWDVTNDEAIGRVRREWLALGREPQPGDVCWIADTALGNERACDVASDGVT